LTVPTNTATRVQPTVGDGQIECQGVRPLPADRLAAVFDRVLAPVEIPGNGAGAPELAPPGIEGAG
jgi:hypothetical protein